MPVLMIGPHPRFNNKYLFNNPRLGRVDQTLDGVRMHITGDDTLYVYGRKVPNLVELDITFILPRVRKQIQDSGCTDYLYEFLEFYHLVAGKRVIIFDEHGDSFEGYLTMPEPEVEELTAHLISIRIRFQGRQR